MVDCASIEQDSYPGDHISLSGVACAPVSSSAVRLKQILQSYIIEMFSLQHKISCEPQTTEVADKRRRQEQRLEQLRCRCTPHVVRCIGRVEVVDSNQLSALRKLGVEV